MQFSHMLGMRGVDIGFPFIIGDKGVATVGRELRRRGSRRREGRPPTSGFTDTSSSFGPTAAVAGAG